MLFRSAYDAAAADEYESLPAKPIVIEISEDDLKGFSFEPDTAAYEIEKLQNNREIDWKESERICGSFVAVGSMRKFKKNLNKIKLYDDPQESWEVDDPHYVLTPPCGG